MHGGQQQVVGDRRPVAVGGPDREQGVEGAGGPGGPLQGDGKAEMQGSALEEDGCQLGLQQPEDVRPGLGGPIFGPIGNTVFRHVYGTPQMLSLLVNAARTPYG